MCLHVIRPNFDRALESGARVEDPPFLPVADSQQIVALHKLRRDLDRVPKLDDCFVRLAF